MQKKIWLFLGIFLILIPSVMSVQPTQQYNQIFVSPFYRSNMTVNTNYSFTLAVNPPDGITSIKSAILTFETWITPTVEFFVWVNNKPCSNPSYLVHTTYADAGLGQIHFDCSNIINKAGNYSIILRPQQANTGSVSGWLDLTYMNSPNPAITISGTEYISGDNGTIFLQLLNSTNQAVNNALCYLKAYYPNKTVLFYNVNMAYFIDSDGLYYYDFVVPNNTGVYMLSANCNFYYNLSYLTSEKDTYVVSTANTSNYGNLTYMVVGGVTGANLESMVQFNVTNITINNVTNVMLYLNKFSGMGNPFVKAQRITSFWNESNVTWGTKPTTDTFSYGVVDTSGSGWFVWNITNLFIGWKNGSYANYGIYLNATPSAGAFNFTSFNTREVNNTYTPYLLITYTQNEQINEIRGSGEVHVSVLNLTANINQSQINSILTAIASVNQTLNTTAMNYLIQINGTTYQINQSQYSSYLSLLTATNSVNATANQSLSFLISLNGSVFQINNTLNSQFTQVLALLNQINHSLNTTLEYKLDLINNTVMQINQSQYDNYISLLNAINSVNSSVNAINLSGILNYLIVINGTVHEINSSQFLYYTNLLQAINSVNSSINSTVIPYLVGINGTTYNINQQIPLILQYLHDINVTTNTTIPASLISINNTQNQHFVDIMNFLASINYTANTTLELKLDQINTTVVQINNTVNNLSTDFTPVLNAINSVNGTLNTTVLNLLNQINTTGNQNQQYLMVINGTVFQINSSIIQIFNDLASINSTQNSNYLSLLNLLFQINQTGNTTLTFVASINQSLLNDYLSLHSFLSSINVSINTTMENKLDLINQTVFQINDSLSHLNLTVNMTGLYDAMASINETINSTILNELLLINSNILNHNSSEYQHFLQLSVLLNDLNYGINTTMENKLDFINSTTWNTLLMLENLTIGNVSVSADVNWTQGYLETSFMGFSDKLDGEGITLSTETLTCLTNATLQHFINGTTCLQGICHSANSTLIETCLHGCANNQCIPTPQFAYASAIGLALIIMGGIYLAYRAWK